MMKTGLPEFGRVVRGPPGGAVEGADRPVQRPLDTRPVRTTVDCLAQPVDGRRGHREERAAADRVEVRVQTPDRGGDPVDIGQG
ncbi:hypothetical protein ACFXKS_39475 [Streptomyces scopuliridis]|uniref:hypothetical protein n=1 Tax=Streptomyces scopuliridis TaxID=452529 RepID=UPI003681084E